MIAMRTKILHVDYRFSTGQALHFFSIFIFYYIKYNLRAKSLFAVSQIYVPPPHPNYLKMSIVILAAALSFQQGCIHRSSQLLSYNFVVGLKQVVFDKL